LNSDSNRKSTPLRRGIKGKNIRRPHKRKSHDDYYESQINEIFNDLVNKHIRVETPEGESMTVSKYYHQARQMLDSLATTGYEHPFEISMSDLSPYLIMMLLDSHRKDYIMYRVVERIINNCDSGLLAGSKKFRFIRFERYPWHFLP
jgi:hypothetical protein